MRARAPCSRPPDGVADYPDQVPDDKPRERQTSLPSSAFTRGVKLAALPVGFAGRTTLGVGKRLGGAPAEAVLLEVQRRTADQIFSVLGQLKGGAMKFGQAMSIFEAALPDEIAGRLPWESHALAGAALLLWVAVPFTALAAAAWRRDPLTDRLSVAAGAAVIAWIVMQILVIRTFSWFQPTYVAIGAGFVWAGRHPH